jgi:hypothetical protein
VSDTSAPDLSKRSRLDVMCQFQASIPAVMECGPSSNLLRQSAETVSWSAEGSIHTTGPEGK